jgi:uncharacterized protein
MNQDQGWWFRLAVLSKLVADAPQPPGRTSLMKFAYLLQTIRNIPLGYRFKLYNYGPYDSSVLSDLSQAETLKAIKSDTVYYSSGYGYVYTVNEKGLKPLCSRVAADLEQYQDDIAWVLQKFGHDSASRLELLSTIIFAEREMRRKQQESASNELIRRVKSIKPHFSDATISEAVDELANQELIHACLKGEPLLTAAQIAKTESRD